MIRLTPREQQVEALMIDGMVSKEIASALGIEPKTADVHRTNIYRKRGVHGLAQLLKAHYADQLAALQPPMAEPAD